MKVVVDNTSVGNAGRALYENQPDQYDVEGLAHLIFAAMLSEEILLDGSSRKLSVPSLNPLLDKLKKEGLNALWTWDMAYPALEDLAPMTDMFSPVRYEKLIEVIAPYLLRYFASNKDVEHLIFKVPPIYRSPDYHDFRAFEIMEDKIRNSLEGELSDDGFHCALYAWRGIYYHEFAKEICAVYFPNPRRSQFIKDIM